MSVPREFAVSVQYEPAVPLGPQKLVGEFADQAWAMASGNPLAAAFSPLGRSSTVATALETPVRHGGGDPGLRLRSIAAGGDVLLRRAYDNRGRLSSIQYPDGVSVRYGYDDDERVRSVEAGPEASVSYAYDPFGRCTAVSLAPAGPSLGLDRAPSGAVEKVRFGSDVLSCVWECGRLASVRASDAFSLTVPDALRGAVPRLRATVLGSPVDCPLAKGVYPVSPSSSQPPATLFAAGPLGVFRSDERGRIAFWLQPNGEPMWFVHRPDGHLGQVWTSNGVTLVDSSGSDWRSVLTPSGARHVRWPVPGAAGPSSAIVGPETVSREKCDAQGRLVSVLGLWGDVLAYSYAAKTGARLPVRISSPRWGDVRLSHDAESRLTAVAAKGAARISLVRRADGALDAVRLDGCGAPPAVLEALRLAGLLYCLNSAGPEPYGASLLWGHFIA